MPPLDNPRHERFAQELAKGSSQSDAYKAAGYDVGSDKSAHEAGSRLSRNVKVQDRVTELQERGARRAEVTVESLIEEAEAARILAMSIDQPSAAIAAVKEKGVLSGRRVERTSNEHMGKDGGPIETADVSARDIISSRIVGLAARGAVEGGSGKPH